LRSVTTPSASNIPAYVSPAGSSNSTVVAVAYSRIRYVRPVPTRSSPYPPFTFTGSGSPSVKDPSFRTQAADPDEVRYPASVAVSTGVERG